MGKKGRQPRDGERVKATHKNTFLFVFNPHNNLASDAESQINVSYF